MEVLVYIAIGIVVGVVLGLIAGALWLVYNVKLWPW